MGIDAAATDFFRPFRQSFYHLLLDFRRLDNLGVEIGFWYGKMQHICRLNIGYLFEYAHQFR